MKERNGNQLWDWMAFIYDQFYQNFPPYLRLHQEIFRNLAGSSPEEGYLLDAGCGTGLLSVELARRGYPVVGVDRSSFMLRQAQAKKDGEKLERLLFLEKDLNANANQDLEGFLFQGILFIHSLYLMKDPRITLQKLVALLPPGGLVILCNPWRRITPGEFLREGRSFSLKAAREKEGFSFLGILVVMLAMGALNMLIQKRKKSVYHCWNEEEMSNLLRSCHLRIRWLKKSCLADSHLLLAAAKEG
jgi:2-polyprenyl-3-methyl-5-hydroxy-6-metoxy-1,4-benzoquinol methylase